MTENAPLKATIDEGSCVPQFGQKAEQICISALERFSQEASLPDDDKRNEALYDKKVCGAADSAVSTAVVMARGGVRDGVCFILPFSHVCAGGGVGALH